MSWLVSFLFYLKDEVDNIFKLSLKKKQKCTKCIKSAHDGPLYCFMWDLFNYVQ